MCVLWCFIIKNKAMLNACVFIIYIFIIIFLNPVDPAGPDCYQSGTKPCEST